MSTEVANGKNNGAVQDGKLMDIELQEYSEQCIREVVEAIRTNQLEEEKKRVDVFYKQYELLYNRYEIAEEKQERAYYFGQLSAAMAITRMLHDERDEKTLFQQIAHNYPKLSQCIIAIGENDSLTGTELRKKLNMKYRSDLSNLIKRQTKYSFIVPYQFGNEHVYMLSNRGKNYYLFMMEGEQAKKKKSNGKLRGTVFALLEALIFCMKRNTVNRINIIAAMSTVEDIDESLFESVLFARRVDELSSTYEEIRRNILKADFLNHLGRIGEKRPNNDWPYRGSRDKLQLEFEEEFS